MVSNKVKKIFFKDVNISTISGAQRDSNINIQLVISLFTKGLSIAITFIQVPLLLRCLGTEAYGIWITIFSVVSWIAIADIGIGSGLRNRLAVSLAKNNVEDGQQYISTAYVSLLVIASIISVIALILIPFGNWQLFFNSFQFANRTLMLTLMIVIVTTVFGFVLALINQILMAIQRNSLSSIPFITSNILLVIVVYIISKFITINVLDIAIIYALTFIIAFVLVSIAFFKFNKQLRPKFSLFRKEKIPGIFSIGIGFFVIQIAGIIFFSTDNYIIAKLFGPSEVSSYSIVLKIFTSINMVFNLALNPLLSAYTEAYVKQDFKWIKGKVNLFTLLLLPVALVTFGIAYLTPLILKLWLHKDIVIPEYLPYLMALFSVVSVWNNIYGFVLGGIGKVRLGAYSSIIMAALNIPLCFLFGVSFHMGVNGVITATIVCMAISSILSPIQVYHFIYKRDRNVKWDKYLR